MTHIYVRPHAPTPAMVKALVPAASPRNLMRCGANIPADLAAELTRAHEVGHALMGTVLRGWRCFFATTQRGPDYAGAVDVRRVDDDRAAPDDNVDLVDLGGLYAELRFIGDVALAWAHIQNATHDLDAILLRHKRPGWRATAWARKYGATTRDAVNYFWPALQAVIAATPLNGRIEGAEVERLALANRPTGPVPRRLNGRLKSTYIVSGSPRRRRR